MLLSISVLSKRLTVFPLLFGHCCKLKLLNQLFYYTYSINESNKTHDIKLKFCHLVVISAISNLIGL